MPQPSSQGYCFSNGHVGLWELVSEEIWVLKNWCFWTVVLEKTLECPLDCKEKQLVHSKEISPGCSLVGLMLKLKLQYFGHLMWSVDSLEKTDAGRHWGQEEKGTTKDKMALPNRWTWVWVNSRSWWWIGSPGVLQFMGSQTVGHDWATELNWTHISICTIYCIISILYIWLKEMTCFLYYFLLFTVYFMHYFTWSPESSSKFYEKKKYLYLYQDTQFYRHKTYQYVLLNKLNKGK